MAVTATEVDEHCAGPLADAHGSVRALVRSHETHTEPQPQGAVFQGSRPGLIFRRRLGVIDDYGGNQSARGFQFQAELLLERRE